MKKGQDLNNYLPSFYIYAFQAKMWRSDLRKFRTILAFAGEKVCASERFGKLQEEK